MITLAGVGAIIGNSDRHVFMIRIKRRGMIRWELPTRVRREGESLYLSLYRCLEEESASQLTVNIGRPVCLGVNSSSQLGHQYFAMFFECQAEFTNIKLTDYTVAELPNESRQEVLKSSFLNWQELDRQEIHPQHQEILKRWQQSIDDSLFAVVSDADRERSFYYNTGTLKSTIIDSIGQNIIDVSGNGGEKQTNQNVNFQTELFYILAERFSERDIKNLCFQLGIDYEDLPDEGKASKIRELLLFLKRRENISLLIETGKRIRADINWPNYKPS